MRSPPALDCRWRRTLLLVVIVSAASVSRACRLDPESFAGFGNISTRGFVGTGDNVMIGGLIVRDTSFRNRPQAIVLRGIGPSLSGSNIANPVADPQLTLFHTQTVGLVRACNLGNQ